MISGLGTDIVEIPKIKEIALRWKERFLDRVFTRGEQRDCLGRSDPYPGLAGRFAAKEAAKKALSSFGLASLPFLEIEVKKDRTGAPRLVFGGRAAARLRKVRSHVSLSHHGHYATATVILEK